MRKSLGGTIIGIGVVLLAGCATGSLAWVKADQTDGNAASELADCRALARDEAWRMDWEMRWPPRFYDSRFMPPFYRAARPFWLGYPMSIEREHALVDFCMHSKGYRLERLPH
jgi:hypothetical protein